MVNNPDREVFYNNVGSYLGLINQTLSKQIPLEPLSNYIKVEGGFAFKSSNYINSGVPIVRISDFNNEKIDLSNAKYYEEQEHYEKYRLQPNDVIIAMTGGTIGKLAIVQEGLGKLYLNQRVGKFKVLDDDKIEQEYVYWLARGIQNKVKNLGYGGAQPNISNKQLEAMEFPFPSKNIQCSIIQFLNDMMEGELNNNEYFNKKIETQIRVLHDQSLDLFNCSDSFNSQFVHTSQLRQAILQEAAQGKLVSQDPNDEPASALLERIKIEKEQLIADKIIRKAKPLPAITDDEIPYVLPKGWKWSRLGNITHNFGQKKPDRKFTYVDVGSINKEKGIISNEFQLLEPNEAPSRARKIVKYGCVIYSTVRPYLLNIAIVDREFEFEPIVSTAFAVLNPLCNNEAKFLYYYLRSQIFIDYVESQMIGMAYPAINDSKLYKGLIPIPPLAEQKRIVAKVDELMSLCDRLEEQINDSKDNADMLMQAVLKEAFEA